MKTKTAMCKLVLPVILCALCSSLFAYGAEVDETSSLEPTTKELSAAQDGLNRDSNDSAALDSEPTPASAPEPASAPAATTAPTNTSASGDTQGKEQAATPKDSIIVGDADKEVSEAKVDDTQDTEDKTPKIVEIGVSSTFNKGAKGLDYFKDIRIDLVGDNLTDDHFLTPEGLYWSDKTKVELIEGKALGNFDFSEYTVDPGKAYALAYRTNVGDSGRLTYVGKTKSGIDLDLIWTVTGSDQEEWAKYSGFNTGGIKGLTFVSEGIFTGATGNSIAVIYNNASNLGLNYRIVAHGTTTDMPVILSFISSDIDSAQGVETDLANILELIPDDNNLTKKDGIIYDKTPGVVNVNGSKDLPHGGYLGASFLSSFNYNFYSPAPERINDSYLYPTAVRYDIFGSSLQARLEAKLKRHMSVSYVDTYGKELKPLVSYE